MTNLVRGGRALLRHNRGGAHVAAIQVEVIGTRLQVFGEVAIAVGIIQRWLHVNVESAMSSLSERLLHGQVVTVVGPVWVDGPTGAFVQEIKLRMLESLIQFVNLVKGILSLYST